MEVASRLLRQCRRGSQLSQRQLARRARIRQPSVATIESGAHDPGVGRLDRLLASVGHRLIAIPARSHSAADAAEEIYHHLRAGDENRAYRRLIQLSDDLEVERRGVRVALTVTPPATTGDVRYDAFIAGLVEHVLLADALPVPGWVDEAARCTDVPWLVDRYSDDDIVEVTPQSFLRRGVLVAPSELASV